MLFYNSQMNSRSFCEELPTDFFQWHNIEYYLTIDVRIACKTFSLRFVYIQLEIEFDNLFELRSMSDTRFII